MLNNRILFFFGFLLFLTACKEEVTPPIDPPFESFMTANIAGTNWTASTTTAYLLPENQLLPTRIIGEASNGESISFILEDNTSGTYSLSNPNNLLIYGENNAAPASVSKAMIDNAGEIKITEINTTDSLISGTFSGVVVNPVDDTEKEITMGEFKNLKYATELPTTTTITASIDDSDWTSLEGSGSVSNNSLNISASDQFKTVILTFPEGVNPGTYALDGSEDGFNAFYSIKETNLIAESGSVVVLSHDLDNKEITGTFEFEAAEVTLGTPTASVKKGTFNCIYE